MVLNNIVNFLWYNIKGNSKWLPLDKTINGMELKDAYFLKESYDQPR